MGTFLLFLKGLRMKRHLCNTFLNFGRNSKEDKKPLHQTLIVLLFTLTEFDNNIPGETLEKQIIKLSITSRAIEAKHLQYKVLRNTCITNNKLHAMKILDSPKCTLCNHESQDSTHRFYYCPQAQKTWQLLTNITSLTPYPHYFSF